MEHQLCVRLGVGPVIWDNFCHQVRHVAFWGLNERDTAIKAQSSPEVLTLEAHIPQWKREKETQHGPWPRGTCKFMKLFIFLNRANEKK